MEMGEIDAQWDDRDALDAMRGQVGGGELGRTDREVAAAVDGAKFGEIAGTIAGDDTVLIITPDRKSRESLQKKIESLVTRPLRGR